MNRHMVRAIALVTLLALPFVAFATGDAEGGDGPVELTWIMGNPGQVPLDQADVEAVLDEISVAEVNASVTTLYYDGDRARLALSSGEAFDMIFAAEWWIDFPTSARNGNFADLTDLLPSVTPELYATMPDVVWEGARIDGEIKAIPVKKDYAAELFFRFDKALFVDTLGLNPPALPNDDMDFFGLEFYLEAGKEAYEAGQIGPEGEYPLLLRKGGFPGLDGNFDWINREALLGIPYSAVGTSASTTIVVPWEHPDFIERAEKLHEWFEAEYINQDAAAIEDLPVFSPIKVGQGFYGADAIWSGGDGYIQVISRWQGPYLSTSSIRGAMNAISADSPYVEESLLYQELVNTNQTYRDILRYGIEGTHWDPAGDNLVQITDTGRNRYRPWPFSQGSYSLSSVEAAEGVEVDPNMWNVIFDGYADLVATNTIGFSFDTTPVESQVAAISVIRQKYVDGLYTGTLDPAEAIPAAIAELEAAGIRDVQAEAQRQFDAYVGG